MDFKVGLSAKPKKDAALAKVASEGEKHFKEALKEVVEEIGMCMENARLVDQRVKEMAGQAAFEIEKKLAESGNARITHLARALGFDVEIDEDEPSDDEAMATLGEVEEVAEEADEDDGDDGTDFNLDDDEEEDDGEFNFDDDDEDGDDDGEFNFDDDDDDGDDDEAFNFDDDDGDDDDEFKFD